MAKFLEFAANLLKVVNLAVEDQPVPRGRIVHGLVAGRGEVKDSEPPRTQANARVGSEASGSSSVPSSSGPRCARARVPWLRARLTSGERFPTSPKIPHMLLRLSRYFPISLRLCVSVVLVHHRGIEPQQNRIQVKPLPLARISHYGWGRVGLQRRR